MSSVLRSDSTLHRFVRYDARREIMQCVGDLSDLELFGTQIIAAPYVHSGLLWAASMGFPIEERLSLDRLYEMYAGTKGIVAQRESLESIFQGKVLLVVKTGESADRIKEGDWIVTLQENTRGLRIRTGTSRKSRVLDFLGITNYEAGYPCKFVYEADVYGRIPDPDMVV